MLLTRTRGAAPAAPAATPGQSKNLVQDLERVETFPTLSDTVVRAMALANNPEASLNDFASLIERDVSVTAAVIKLAGSAAYSAGAQVKDVHHAVMRIGLRECYNLIAAVGMRSMFKQYPASVQALCDALLRHSLFTAKLATNLNRILKAGFSGEEFTAALLHDIGRIVIAIRAPTEIAEFGLDFEEDDSLLVRERALYGIDHCSVGSFFALKNKLPAAIGKVISNHHRPEQETAHPKLVALIGFADHLANRVQRAHKLTGYNPGENPGYRILSQGWEPRFHDLLLRGLKSAVLPAMRDTRAMLKSAQRS